MTRLLALVGCSVGLAVAAAAADPTPTAPAATPTVAPTPTPPARSLAEAARRIKLRPYTTDASGRIVISDTTLPEMAEKGAVTSVGGDRPGDRRYVDVDSGEAAGGESGSMDEEQQRQFWRRKVEAQQQAIQVLEARIAELDSEIPRLWTQYYAWDDPAYRDGVIKVRLDRALEEWEQLKERLPAEQARLDEIMEDARRAGAKPGWFRDLR